MKIALRYASGSGWASIKMAVGVQKIEFRVPNRWRFGTRNSIMV